MNLFHKKYNGFICNNLNSEVRYTGWNSLIIRISLSIVLLLPIS